MATNDITRERLKERLSYNPETGLFTWLSTYHHFRIGKHATSLQRLGYIQIRIDGRTYLAHRLAWLYMTGEWPDEIDHINGVKTDNRWSNLRNGTTSQNQQNQKRAQNGSVSGLLGAYKCTGCKTWRATIFVNGKCHWLGTFKTAEEAHAAYVAAKRRLHPFGTL